MNKSLLVVLGVVAAAIAGYLVLQEGPRDTNDTMEKEDAMMEDDAMKNDDDAAMKKDEGMMQSSDAMMKKDEGMMQSSDAMMKKDEAAMEKSSAAYLAYSDGVIGNGKTSVLFFHASWCPSCRQGDKDLAGIYGKGNAKVNTYKVDYDTSTELKQRYGVTYQHTFVLIDGQGKALKTLQGASAAELAALING